MKENIEEINKRNQERRLSMLKKAKEFLQKMRESYSKNDENDFFAIVNEFKLHQDEVGLTESDKKTFNWTIENF